MDKTLAEFVLERAAEEPDSEAKRRIVERELLDDLPPSGVLRSMAQEYADHPDFRDDWRL